MGKSEKIGVPSHIFRNFSKFCWNKLYILGCLYVVYNILDMWTLCGVTEKQYRTLHVTNNDADQLYARPTVLHSLYRQIGGIHMDLGGYRCLGAYGCMGVCGCMGAYGHMGNVQTYRGM